MKDYDKELEFWKKLLDSGEIDEETYNNELSKINQKVNNTAPIKKYNVPRIIKSCLPALIPIILLVIMIAINSGNILGNNHPGKVEKVADLDNLPVPEQSSANGRTTKKINGVSYELKHVASYSISGRVVDVHSYYSSDVLDNISTKDIGLSWGALAQNNNDKKVKWWTNGDRHLYCEYTDSNWVATMGGSAKIDSSFSNNHLIFSKDELETMASHIKKGDFIKITGFLVDIHCEKDNYFYDIKTSTSRNDSGDGACEIIYVTDIAWLEE